MARICLFGTLRFISENAWLGGLVLLVLRSAWASTTFLESPSPAHASQACWNVMWYIEFANRVSTRSDSLSRVQYIMSLGQPCVDLVFYRLTFEDDNFDPTYAISHTPINSLIGRGYTYEYASPAMFELDSSVVHDG